MAVAVPTLTYADANDGTGGTLTVANSTVGATNTAYVQRLDATWYGDEGWVSKGSRTGDGTITITCAPGIYLCYVLSVSGAESNVSIVLQFRASDSLESVYWQCLIAAQTRVRQLELEDIPYHNVTAWKAPLLRAVGSAITKKAGYPCVILSTMEAETLNNDEGTNYRDMVGYPVGVAIVSEMEGEYARKPEYDHLETGHNRHLKWRERLRKAFINQRLPGVSGGDIIRCIVEPRVPQIAGLLTDGLEGSAMVFRFFSREARGLT